MNIIYNKHNSMEFMIVVSIIGIFLLVSLLSVMTWGVVLYSQRSDMTSSTETAESSSSGTTIIEVPDTAEIGLRTGAKVGLDTGTKVGLDAGTEVALASGAEVALASGAEVALASGTEVAIADGSTLLLAEDATVGLIGRRSTSAGNSSLLALSSGQSFIGTYEDAENYASVSIMVDIDTGSNELCTLTMDMSTDNVGTNKRTKTIIVGNTETGAHTLRLVSRYFRVTVTADQSTSVTGAIQTIYDQQDSPLKSFISEVITGENDCEITRSVITGSTTGGTYRNVTVDSEGRMGVDLERSAFSETVICENRPVFQLHFKNDVVSSIETEQFIVGGGSSITASQSLLTLTNDTGIGDYAVLRSKRKLIYHPGQGALIRFTALFDDNAVALSTQQAGLGNVSGSLAFGYDGDTFGVLQSTGGVSQLVVLTLTVASTGTETATITLDDTVYNDVPLTDATAAADSIAFTAYEISTYTFPGWNVASVGDTVYFISRTSEAKSGAYSLSSATATGTYATTTTGAAKTNNWTPQTSWNVDKMDGTGPSGQTLDVTMGNVYQIKFQWLGYGAITYSIEDSVTGRLVPVHIIRYANQNPLPSLNSPNMSMTWTVASLGSATSLSMSTASAGGFIQGPMLVGESPLKYTQSATRAAVSTETIIIAIRVNPMFNVAHTTGEVKIINASFAADGSKNSTIRIYRDSTIGTGATGDFPNWSLEDASESQISYASGADLDTVDTSTGQFLSSYALSKADSVFIDLTNENILLDANETLVITAESGASVEVTVSITWVEIH